MRLVRVPMLPLSEMTMAWDNRPEEEYAERSDLLYTAKEREYK